MTRRVVKALQSPRLVELVPSSGHRPRRRLGRVDCFFDLYSSMGSHDKQQARQQHAIPDILSGHIIQIEPLRLTCTARLL